MAEMDANEFDEWCAFNELSPLGSERADLRAAQLAAVVANCHRAKHQAPFKAEDFMPQWDQPESKPAQVWEKIKTVFRGFGHGNSRPSGR